MRNRKEQITIYIEDIFKDLYGKLANKAGLTEASLGRILVIKELASCGLLTSPLKDTILAELETKGQLTPELSQIINDGVVA